MTYTNRLEASKDITPRDDAQSVTLEKDVSPFEGFIPRRLEAVGAPLHYFFLAMVQHVMLTMTLSLMAAASVLDMVKLVNEAF